MMVFLLSHQMYEPGPTIPVGVYSTRDKAIEQIPQGQTWWYDITHFEIDEPKKERK